MMTDLNTRTYKAVFSGEFWTEWSAENDEAYLKFRKGESVSVTDMR